MVVLIAEIEGNCFHIILSILLVWHRSDFSMLVCRLLGMLVCITRHLSTALSKLVFPSHCICSLYIIICPVSSAYTIGAVSLAWPQYISCWLWTGHCSVFLFPDYFFPASFANQMLICLMSAAHVSPFFSTLHLRCVGCFEQVIVTVLLYLALFVN